jgi:DNA invertase Pin-like site-specific DNA recombinase
MRCSVYARFSSDLQRQTSIDDQIAVARRYADQQGWSVVDAHIYTDAAVSGSSMEGRPGIQALLAAAETVPRPFDILLVDDSSRVARDLRDALYVLRHLRFSGVRTIYLSQQIDSDNEQAETLLTVHGLVDGLYLQEMSKKIKRGLEGQLQRGFHTGSKTYGYRTEPVLDPTGRSDSSGAVVVGRRLEMDRDQAQTIRQVFRWYAEGFSGPRMVDHLTRAGIPAPRGARWTKSAITRILTNERYLGKQIWGQHTYERRPGTNRRVRRQRSREDWHVFERPELRIVSDDLWERAQARRRQLREMCRKPGPRARTGGRAGLYSPHLLVGLSRCGVCGGGVSIVAGGRGSPRYGCPNSWQNGLTACDNRLTVRAKVVDPLVLARLQAALVQPDMVGAITDAVSSEVSRVLQEAPTDREQLTAQRDAVARRLARLIEAIEGGTALSSLTQAIARREDELRELDRVLDATTTLPAVDLAVFPTWVRQQLADLSELLRAAPERAKAEFSRLSVTFTISPVRDEGRPFLRAEATGDLMALCGTTNLPTSSRKTHLTIETRLRERPDREKSSLRDRCTT